MNRFIQGRLTLTIRSPGGEVLARRGARNLVLRKGAAVVARLFAGVSGSTPINRVQVGFGRDAGTAELVALTPPQGDIPPDALSSPLGPDAFAIAADGPDSVRVSVTAVFTPAVDLPDVTEAGLLAGDELYNQVVFEPVTLRLGQNITFFWEIDFPFGR
jgi:hypothetical protein